MGLIVKKISFRIQYYLKTQKCRTLIKIKDFLAGGFF